MPNTTYRIPTFGQALPAIPKFSLGGSQALQEETPQVIEVDAPPSSFIEAVQDSSNGRMGGSAQSAYFRLPGTNGEPNRYVWLSHDGTGVDPGLYVPILAGHIGHEVSLAAGNHTAASVAASIVAVVDAIPNFNSAIVAGNTLSVTGPIRASDAATGTSFENRGSSSDWGLGALLTGGTGYTQGVFTTVAASRSVAPLGGGVVRAIRILHGGSLNVLDQWRIALWEGGSSSSPVGANLIWDAGQVDMSAGSPDTWTTLYVPSSPLLTVGSGSNLWLSLKSNSGLSRVAMYAVASSPSIVGEMETSPGLRLSDGGMSTDPAVPYESVWPGTTTASPTFVLGMQIIYEQAPYATDGSWQRWFGVSQEVLQDLASRAINSTDYMLAALPNMEGLFGIQQSIGIGNAIASPQFRIMNYVGGLAENPNNASLAWDGGQVSASMTNAYFDSQMPSPPSEVSYTAGQRIALGVKNDNAAGSEVLYTANLSSINPVYAPMDFSVGGIGDDPFYRINPANPNHHEDPTIAAEATILTDVSDTTPSEYMAVRIQLGTPGFVVREG